MRAFNPEQLSDGKYQILSGIVHEDNNLFVVTRGKKIQLAIIPVSVINAGKYLDMLRSTNFGPLIVILVIESNGGFRIARVCVGNEKDLESINAHEPPGGTLRSTGDIPGIPGYF